jgi:hypothetical protein
VAVFISCTVWLLLIVAVLSSCIVWLSPCIFWLLACMNALIVSSNDDYGSSGGT